MDKLYQQSALFSKRQADSGPTQARWLLAVRWRWGLSLHGHRNHAVEGCISTAATFAIHQLPCWGVNIASSLWGAGPGPGGCIVSIEPSLLTPPKLYLVLYLVLWHKCSWKLPSLGAAPSCQEAELSPCHSWQGCGLGEKW